MTFMEKRTKLLYALFGTAVLSAILHNVVSGVLGSEEAVLFTLTLLSGAAFVVLAVASAVSSVRSGKPKDLWKVGWLGLFGFVGLIPGSSPKLCYLFVLFGFFGCSRLRRRSRSAEDALFL